jgi:hypothetical protein
MTARQGDYGRPAFNLVISSRDKIFLCIVFLKNDDFSWVVKNLAVNELHFSKPPKVSIV